MPPTWRRCCFGPRPPASPAKTLVPKQTKQSTAAQPTARKRNFAFLGFLSHALDLQASPYAPPRKAENWPLEISDLQGGFVTLLTVRVAFSRSRYAFCRWALLAWTRGLPPRRDRA